MKNALIVAAVALAVIALSYAAHAAQYNRPKPYVEPQDTGLVAFAEKTKSMSDCMTFSASHKSKGAEGDKAEFNHQFGAPLSESGAAAEYSYDNYTKVILDCAKKSCSCRCLQK